MLLTNKQLIVFLLILLGIVFFLPHQHSSLYNTSDAPRVIEYAEAIDQPSFIIRNVPQAPKGKYEYLEITEGCVHGTGELCIWAYAGPGVDYKKVYELEKGMLLRVEDTKEVHGQMWYHVRFDEWLRRSERTPKDWYVPSIAGRIVYADGTETVSSTSTTTKHIVVDLSEQMIYAYDGETLFFKTKVSTGEYPTLTPVGTFAIYKKTPSRYMQGPLPGVSDVPFDLPGVPWNMYFTQGGAVIHGAYWHDRYGTEQSDGCVNVPPEIAKILYDWAPVGTKVIVQR